VRAHGGRGGAGAAVGRADRPGGGGVGELDCSSRRGTQGRGRGGEGERRSVDGLPCTRGGLLGVSGPCQRWDVAQCVQMPGRKRLRESDTPPHPRGKQARTHSATSGVQHPLLTPSLRASGARRTHAGAGGGRGDEDENDGVEEGTEKGEDGNQTPVRVSWRCDTFVRVISSIEKAQSTSGPHS
jgi:hypothetical protein